jgi:ArsR family transcriptional regulator, virulence genes transcriptional regulator
MTNPTSILKAIANKYRLQILAELSTGEKNVSAINQAVKVSQPALSQHLSKLRKAGIIKHRREQRKMYYYISNMNVVRIIGIANEMAA